MSGGGVIGLCLLRMDQPMSVSTLFKVFFLVVYNINSLLKHIVLLLEHFAYPS
jgi:hypothetical protein